MGGCHCEGSIYEEPGRVKHTAVLGPRWSVIYWRFGSAERKNHSSDLSRGNQNTTSQEGGMLPSGRRDRRCHTS